MKPADSLVRSAIRSAISLKQGALLLEKLHRFLVTKFSKPHWHSTRRMPRISMNGIVVMLNRLVIPMKALSG